MLFDMCCCKLIELRKYKRMHVYRARSSKRTRIYGLVRAGGGGGGGGGEWGVFTR